MPVYCYACYATRVYDAHNNSCKVNKRILAVYACKFIPVNLQPANGQLHMCMSYMRVLPVDVDEIDKFDCTCHVTWLLCVTYIVTLCYLHCYSALLALLLCVTCIVTLRYLHCYCVVLNLLCFSFVLVKYSIYNYCITHTQTPLKKIQHKVCVIFYANTQHTHTMVPYTR